VIHSVESLGKVNCHSVIIMEGLSPSGGPSRTAVCLSSCVGYVKKTKKPI